MGSASRQRKHAGKMARKRQAKAARRALYASYAGKSKKAKRVSKKSGISGTYKHAHRVADCGNPGCQRCNPRKVFHGASGLSVR